MSRKFTITLTDNDLATLQEYVNECNKHTNWQNPENAIVEIVYQWLFKWREHKAFMLKLKKDIDEILTYKSQK